MATMSKRERVWRAVHGETVDRPPFVVWHHFKPHNVPRAQAQATLDFFGRYDLDIYKIMPDIPYPFPSNSIRDTDDWGLVSRVEPDAGNFARMVETTELVRRGAGPDVPIVVTVFSPFHEVRRIAGGEDALLRNLRDNPIAVHRALGTIADNLAGYCRSLLAAGADGIYFAVPGIAGGWLSEAEFREFSRPYDVHVLDACDAGWLNVVHLHGTKDLMLDLAIGYPGSVLSWDDRLTGVRLADVGPKFPDKALMGGIDEFGAIVRGDVEVLTWEIQDALAQTGGRHLILAPGCSVPDDIDERNLATARKLVDELTAKA